ncbi:beta-lactamase/transpeptidase-like protein [Aspergillus terricola var. indicus]
MDVRKYVKELEGIRVLGGLGKDSLGQEKPVLDPVEGQITLRHPLTHTSGLVYDSSSPLLQQWSKSQGRTAHTFCGSMEGYTHPLLFQPGTSWGYGAGLDWAGMLIERITGVRLSTYIKHNIA